MHGSTTKYCYNLLNRNEILLTLLLQIMCGLTNTIAIGAVNQENHVANFSSRGPSYDGRIKPDIVAKGVGVYGANAEDFSAYVTRSGTSVAAPIASGIAALLLSAYPHLKNTQVRNILIETADNSFAPNNNRGYGLVSAVKAIEFPNLDSLQYSIILATICRYKLSYHSLFLNIYFFPLTLLSI